MLDLRDGFGAVRIASLWLLCEVEQGLIVDTSWQSSWSGAENDSLRQLVAMTRSDAMAAAPYLLLRGTKFQCSVWKAVMRIPYGNVVSYSALGRSIGCSCAQAVGQALKLNRIFWFVPCHRVVAANGTLGGYSPGGGVKRCLLEYEANVPQADKTLR